MTPKDQADIDEFVRSMNDPSPKRYTKPQMVKVVKPTARELRKQARWGSKRNWGHQRRG